MITIAKGKYTEWMTEDGLLRIFGWARDGLTEEQIAHNMGVAYSTFRTWVDRFPALLDTLKKGKAPVDIEVENALLNSARGFIKTIKKPIKVKTKRQLAGKGTIEEEHIEFVDEEIYIPPNPTAQIFWLKNRRPDRWRDRPEIVENTDAVQKLDQMIAEVRKVAFDS